MRDLPVRPSQRVPAPAPEAGRGGLAGRELLVVTGKGGVGKSAVAAALGKVMAEGGLRTLVLEVDPRESIHRMFGQPPSGGEVLELGPRLYLQNLQPGRVIDQAVREILKVGVLARRVLESPVYQHFAEGAPGLKELAVLGYAERAARGTAPGAPEVDLVVLDAPATGHGVSLLAAPLLVSEVIQQGPIGRMTRQVAALIRDRERSGVLVVTLAEEMPVAEALELRSLLAERLDRAPDLLVVNGLYPPLPGGAGAGEDLIATLWRRRRRLNDRELARLAKRWPGARLELPLLPVEKGAELVEALAARLAGFLAGAAA